MKNKIRVFIALTFGLLLLVGWDFRAVTSATVPGTNAVVDLNSSGVEEGSGLYNGFSVSTNGRYVAFASAATNLATSDTNGVADVFVRDTVSNTITRVSVASDGTQANDYSQAPYITGNGRYVVFESNASNIADVSAITHYYNGLYIHDMQTGTTQLLAAGYYNGTPTWSSHLLSIDSGQISEDGNIVAYSESGGPTSNEDAFVLNRLTNATTQINHTSTGGNPTSTSSSQIGSISCDGRFVMLNSNASNLVSGQSTGHFNAFMVDALNNYSIKDIALAANATTLVNARGLSCDGNYVAVSSNATNLVSGDTNSSEDVFLYDVVHDTYALESTTSSGTQGNSDSDTASVSDDGRYIGFESSATNLVTGDTNNTEDIFLRDTSANTTQLVSRNSTGTIGNDYSGSPQIERDGRAIVYSSWANNLVSGDTNGTGNVFKSATQ